MNLIFNKNLIFTSFSLTTTTSVAKICNLKFSKPHYLIDKKINKVMRFVVLMLSFCYWGCLVGWNEVRMRFKTVNLWVVLEIYNCICIYKQFTSFYIIIQQLISYTCKLFNIFQDRKATAYICKIYILHPWLFMFIYI